MENPIVDIISRLMTTLNRFLERVDEKDVDRMIDMILSPGAKIFVAGLGRTGLSAKGFAMRLMHMGFNAYVVGEVSTPAAGRGDLLIAVSRSGETSTTLALARKAKDMGLQLLAVTSHPNSTLSRLSDHTVKIPVDDPAIKAEVPPVMGTFFEIACMIFFDSVVYMLMKRTGQKEEDMKARHATLE